MYTPSPLHDGAGGTLPEDDSVSKLSEDFSSTENRDVTEIDEEINLGRFKASPQVAGAVPRTGISSGAHSELHKLELHKQKIFPDSVTESGAGERFPAPKIWISKSASMEHDLD